MLLVRLGRLNLDYLDCLTKGLYSAKSTRLVAYSGIWAVNTAQSWHHLARIGAWRRKNPVFLTGAGRRDDTPTAKARLYRTRIPQACWLLERLAVRNTASRLESSCKLKFVESRWLRSCNRRWLLCSWSELIWHGLSLLSLCTRCLHIYCIILGLVSVLLGLKHFDLIYIDDCVSSILILHFFMSCILMMRLLSVRHLLRWHIII